ncbi:hypothetical protein V5799_017523 [Amblyomma americanum]|uniref:GH18 domain-containing protein n=1 Tax=Amblyomma americanum TaxID=6943 RepID=A0AAQ4F306_AMBAM
MLLVGGFVFVIAFDVLKEDYSATAVFPVKVRSQRHKPVPILCHVNVARFYDRAVPYSPTDLPGNYCSHLVLALRGFLSGGSGKPYSTFGLVQSRLIELRDEMNKSFPHLRYLVAAGDENDDSRPASHETPNATVLRTFLAEMVRWLLQIRIHGLVLDRVFLAGSDYRWHTTAFLSHLKKVMHKHGLLFIVTATSDAGTVRGDVRLGRLSKFLDYVGVVTHGMHRAANASDRILVPFYHQRGRKGGGSVEDSIEHAISGGVPRRRLLVTISLSGYMCTVSKLPGKNEVPTWSNARDVRVVSYGEACRLMQHAGWAVSLDRESEKPHAWRNNLWMGYEDEISVRKTASLVDKMFLGGVIIWDVGSDDYSGRCGLMNPLVRAVFTEVEGTPTDDSAASIIPTFNATDGDASIGHILNETNILP